MTPVHLLLALIHQLLLVTDALHHKQQLMCDVGWSWGWHW
jgi:hypothetical protein